MSKLTDKIVTSNIKFVEIDIVALTEQLNGLLKSYDSLYGLYMKIIYTSNKEIAAEEKEVLDDLRQAIKAICFTLSHREVIVE